MERKDFARQLDGANALDLAENYLDVDIRTHRPKNLLDAFNRLVELVEDSELSDDFMDVAKPLVRYLTRKLHLKPMQVILLSIFVDKSDDRSIRLSEIASYIDIRTTKLLMLGNDIDELVRRRYIRKSQSRENVSYRVPDEVIMAIRQNREYLPERPVISNTQAFFDYLNEITDEVEDGELSHEEFSNAVRDGLEDIKDSHLVRTLSKILDGPDTILFLHMAHLFVENQDDNIGFSDLKDIYDKKKLPAWVKLELRERSSSLFEEHLIENTGEDGLLNPESFKLTDFAKEDLLRDLSITLRGRTTKDLISPDSFSEKTLFFNENEEGQIQELGNLLSEERFAEVQRRLEEAGMRKGFCCLLYGAPGTGKTETVYQLAKRTGRTIMRVDVDKVKSCWVGESEKNVKGLFDRYRNLCRTLEKAPILLFNEADAVLGIRMEGATKAVEKMENSLQNIILQEMETLEGIMIATTNLTSNLDAAFERRFLYKVKYEKPSVESKIKIWRLMLPALTEEQAATLARKFDFSGGEIENISRKHTVRAILSGEDSLDFDKVLESCRDERIASTSIKRVGF